MSSHPDLFGHERVEADKWTALFSAQTDEWPTDWAVVEDWRARIGGGFNLDVCATKENAKSLRFYTKEQNGLVQPWCEHAERGTVWCNPPYSDIDPFVTKAFKESALGCTVVMLLPSRTDRPWFHAMLVRPDVCEIFFARGRLRFGDAENVAPFPSVVVVFRPPHAMPLTNHKGIP